MAYKSSPRPTFDRPTHIPYAGVTRYLWGDDESSKVDDWIYVSSAKIHELVLAATGGCHSTEFRTVFGADGLHNEGIFPPIQNQRSACRQRGGDLLSHTGITVSTAALALSACSNSLRRHLTGARRLCANASYVDKPRMAMIGSATFR
jgi:hypothetical protein